MRRGDRAGAVTVRMNCFDRRTLMVLSLTLSSGFSKSSAIVRPAEPALSWITLRLESFASYIHASYAGQEKESCINKIRKNYENLLNISVYPIVILFPCSRIFAPSILSSVLHMAGTECRAGPRRVLHWDDVGETQKRCSSGLRKSPLDEKASSGGPPGELS